MFKDGGMRGYSKNTRMLTSAGLLVSGFLIIGVLLQILSLTSIFLLALTALASVVVLNHPSRLLVLSLVMGSIAMLPLPRFLPTSVMVAGGTLFFADIICCMIIAVIFTRVKILNTSFRLGILAAGLLIGAASMVGLIKGASPFDVISDMRGLVYMVTIGLGVAISLFDRQNAATIYLRGVAFISIYSGAAVGIELLFKAEFFAIRTNSAVLYTASGNSASEALRLIPTSGLFCVVLSGVLIGLWVSGQVKSNVFPLFWPVVASGVFIGFQGFSRNNLVAFFIAILIIIFINMSVSTSLRFIGAIFGIAVLLASAWQIVAMASPRTQILFQQSLEAFEQRVIVGLRPGVVSEDYSSQWRARETAAGIDSIQASPLGTGLGIPYRSWLYGDPFTSDYGHTYIHNSYLWLPIKTGILGALVISVLLVLLAVSILRARNRANPIIFSTIIASAAALAVVMFVSPLPFSRGDGVLCGVVLGLCCWSLGRSETHQARFEERSAFAPRSNSRNASVA